MTTLIETIIANHLNQEAPWPDEPKEYPVSLASIISQRLWSESKKDYIYWPWKINTDQYMSLCQIFGQGVRYKTRAKICECFKDSCKKVKITALVGRVYLSKDKAIYIPGQDYPLEIALLRKTLIASY